MRLEGLQSGTTYQARAVSKNGAGVEAPAEWQTFTTGGIGEFYAVMPGGTPPIRHGMCLQAHRNKDKYHQS